MTSLNPWMTTAAVAGGGALGSVSRLFVATWFADRFGTGFPYGTLFINVTGSFVIGLVLGWATLRPEFNPYLRFFLATGVLGGYTTFSTFAYETIMLAKGDAFGAGLLYVIASVVLGLCAAVGAVQLVRTLV